MKSTPWKSISIAGSAKPVAHNSHLLENRFLASRIPVANGYFYEVFAESSVVT